MSSANKVGAAVAFLGLLACVLLVVGAQYAQAGLVFVATAGVSWWVRQALVPYQELSEAVDRLAGGDLSQPRLTVTWTGEAGRMATAFNQLLTQLRMLSEEATELANGDRKSTRLNSSHVRISYAVFCLK